MALAQYRLDKENDALNGLDGLDGLDGLRPRENEALNALDGLDGLRSPVASRAGEQHDHLRKGVLQFGHVSVFGTGAREFRARLFADARMAAQATRRQQGIAQITE